ncbi:type 2 lantipeptide synthetase LanM [Amycolatopsis sp. K13G38]|uniref:Type 2 lantipeptide synthetase LanM n=1 Tax=Amycolatopsis acididurans TaxID=2724524 RepID=A0ABX1JD98_9PSEU|nr:type 2 lanthipeptide synthetase LanM family protein [Amycolatopsis acididurans]NKQ57767.1 type 2 lantipeptide synthetase LanM [Amycolatopsis acididurans]
MDSLSEQDLLTLLAEPADELRTRLAREPAWLVALRRALVDTPPRTELLTLLDDVENSHPLGPWLPALGPLFQRALDALHDHVDALREEYPFVPIQPDTLSRAFLRNISATVLFQMSKPFILEMNIARLRGSLRGETPAARFDDFSAMLRQEGIVASILVKYPVLARQLVLTVEQWADYLCEFLTNLCADREVIRTTLAGGRDPGPLLDIDAGMGDRHRSGRSVLLLRFASGLRVLYKPRPLAVEAHFQELLSWLNEHGADPPLCPHIVVDRGDYGWCEFVAPASCTSEAEVARFYRRQGSYLALLYALCAADLHNENLIAVGEHPILVDLEALFHPTVHGGDRLLTDNLAAGALDQSVWQVGILPRRIWSDEQSVGVDMSGLGGQEGQMNPHRLVSWTGVRTDEMRLGREHVELPASDNRPRLRDREVDAVDYRDALLRGFTDMYRLLCRHRTALLQERLPRFAHDEIRVVVRSTNVYGLLWYESFHPDLLRDALDRDRFLDRIWAEAATRPYLTRLIGAERHDLLRGDIPVFRTRPDSCAIVTSEGESIADFFDAPSLDLARQRMERLGDEDLAKQTWIIEASLATLLMGRETIPRPQAQLAAERPVESERLLALADTCGKRIDELALRSAACAHWLGVGPLDESAWGLFPSGIDLYAGNPGIALFLAYLGAVTRTPSYTELAYRAFTPVSEQYRQWLAADGATGQEPADMTVGAFDGLGSFIYLLANLGVLWSDSSLLDEAEDVVARLPPFIARDDHLDVVYGSAGCLLCLLALHAVRPSPRTLDAAIRCGERLVATAQPASRGKAWTTLADQPRLGGFSHGTAGIATSLLRLAAVSGIDRFGDLARQALSYDRSLFIPELGNWADLRVFSAPPGADRLDETTAGSPAKSMVAWCHGAAGIGLGRLATLSLMDGPEVHTEIEAALSATTRFGFDINHSLCHGALGNAELLLTAARTLRRTQDRAALEQATAVIVSSIEADGPATGVPLGIETPGFMTGLAGVGYGLLRLAEPDKVPCVLLLAPPQWQTQP